MITVYEVTAPRIKSTRLFLPNSAWGQSVREKLAQMGCVVAATTQDHWPDTRDAAELARKDALLAETGL